MKCYADRLRELPVEVLREMIARQRLQVETAQRDLEMMIRVLSEKESIRRNDFDNYKMIEYDFPNKKEYNKY